MSPLTAPDHVSEKHTCSPSHPTISPLPGGPEHHSASGYSRTSAGRHFHLGREAISENGLTAGVQREGICTRQRDLWQTAKVGPAIARRYLQVQVTGRSRCHNSEQTGRGVSLKIEESCVWDVEWRKDPLSCSPEQEELPPRVLTPDRRQTNESKARSRTRGADS